MPLAMAVAKSGWARRQAAMVAFGTSKKSAMSCSERPWRQSFRAWFANKGW
jgi:hypothetical protein